MSVSLAFHCVGFVLWLGGLMILTRFTSLSHSGGDSPQRFANSAARVYKGYILPGMVVVILSGLHQLGAGGAAHYFQQGWFHGKLTLVLVLIVATVIFGLQLKKLREGSWPSSAVIHSVHGIAGATLVGAVFATFLGR
jgi:putative membrane protein